MRRVARFAVDERFPAARRFLAGSALIPRSRRERWALEIDRLLRRVGFELPPQRLAAPGATAEAPRHDAAFEVARALLPGDSAPLRGGLDLLPAPHHLAPARLLFLWRGSAEAPFAIAKLVRDEHAARLAGEAAALARIAGLPAELAERAPRVLGSGSEGGLTGLVQSLLPGRSLARLLSERPPGHWPEKPLRQLGEALGALQAGGLEHGDAWSRNALIDDEGSFAGFVDWEAAADRTAPGREALRFLVTSARADLAARGPRWAALAGDAPRLLDWILDSDRPGAAVRGFLAAWSARLDLPQAPLLDEAAAAGLGLPGSPPPKLLERLNRVLQGETCS